MGTVILRAVSSRATRSSAEPSPGVGCRGERNRCAHCAVTFGGEQRNLAAEGVSDDRDAVSVHLRQSLQESETGEGVIEVVARHEQVLQVSPGYFAVGGLFLLQKVANEWTLVSRKALTAAEQI